MQNNDIPAHGWTTKTGLTVFLILLAAGPWLPPTVLWGLNHAAWLPAWSRVLVPLAGILLVWTRAGAAVGTWLETWLSNRLTGKTWLVYGVIPVAGAVVFWFLRERTHMLGDGQTLAVMMAGDNLYHGFDFMTYHLLARIYQATGAGGESAAFSVFAAAACLCGAAFLAAAGWSARRLTEDPASRILLYGLLVLGAGGLLFFGYAEVYAPLSVAMLLFLTSFLLYREGRGSLLAVAASWGIGLFFHLNALFLAPLLVLALIRPPAGDTAPLLRRLATLVWPPAAALALAGVIYVAGGYDPARFREDFGHMGQGSGILVPLGGPEGLFTWRHLKDTFNLVLLLAPMPLLLLLANLRRGSAGWGSSSPRADLLIGTVWLIALMTLVHFKLGAVRDWDLFAPHATLFVFAGWYAATGGRDNTLLSGTALGPILATAMLLILPWFAVNTAPNHSLARLEAVSADMSPYALGLLHEQFAYHHQLAGNPAEVIRHYHRCGEVCPTHPRFHAIYGTHMLNQGDYAESVAAYDRAVAADSTYVYGLKMGLLARVMNADYAGALEPARLLNRLGDEDAEAAAAHGMAAQQMGLMDEAEAAYLRGYTLDSDRLDLLERAAGLQLLGRQFNAAESSFRRLVSARPDYGQAALGLADAIWQDYLAGGESREVETNQARLTEAVGLIERVIALEPGDRTRVEGLQSWLGQVRSALADPAGD